MTIAEAILTYLQESYRSGMTQNEIALKHAVQHPVIQRLLADKRRVDGLTLRTVQRMFPAATINLFGCGSVNQIGSSAGQMTGINHGSMVSKSDHDFRERAIGAVLEMDIGAEDKIKVMKMLKDL